MPARRVAVLAWGASLAAWVSRGFFTLPADTVLCALGLTIACFALVGFLGAVRLVGARAGPFAGAVVGSALVLAVYPASQLYLRGDLSEYAGTMALPWVVHALLATLEAPSPARAAALACSVAALLVLHPGVGLIGGLAAGGTVVALAAGGVRGGAAQARGPRSPWRRSPPLPGWRRPTGSRSPSSGTW
jgi:hypothetical protein